MCITLLIVAFTLLWLYVSMSGARREQPNLSALYQQTPLRPSAAGQSRSPRAAAKGKGKSKQVRAMEHGQPRSCFVPVHTITNCVPIVYRCALIGTVWGLGIPPPPPKSNVCEILLPLHLHRIQVEGSPRPSVQKTTTSETAAVSSQKATLPTQQAAQTGKASSDAPATKPAGNKGKKKRQAAQASETADSAPKPQLEEGDQGRN